MKKQVVTLFVLFFFIFNIQPLEANNASVNEPLQKVAVIIDSPEFYHSSYTDDILNGFRYINRTYQVDYDVFQLTEYTLVSADPYEFSYIYNGSITNHTQLIETLIQTNQYDLFVVIGYELRRSFDVSTYPETDFLFYDLSGELPSFDGGSIPENLFVVSFQENEQAFLVGALAVTEYYPLPSKIGIVGFWKGDARTRQLIAGFQSAIFRNTTNVDITISYVDTWIDQEKVRAIGAEFANQDIELVFAALQANNTLTMLNSFTGGNVVCVDLNQSMSVMKNNTRVLTEIFKSFNDSQGFFGGISATFGIIDNIYYPNGWSDLFTVNKTIVELKEEIVEGSLIIPTDIKFASNTPSFSLLMVILIVFPILTKKKRSRNQTDL
ncbi:MAG: BMP family ABC transporter substrate-binding protein [Candidatus Hodarchaeales archaeon]|jgi:hypothetical protein